MCRDRFSSCSHLNYVNSVGLITDINRNGNSTSSMNSPAFVSSALLTNGGCDRKRLMRYCSTGNSNYLL